VVSLGSVLDAGEDCGPEAEACGRSGQGDVLGLPGGAEVVDDRGGDAAGKVFEHLSGDGSFEHAQDFWGWSSGGAVPGDVGLGRPVAGHSDNDDVVVCVVRATAPPRESRSRVILPEDAGTGAVPHSAANEASLRSRSGLAAGGDEQL
jgi:hypothetical protein